MNKVYFDLETTSAEKDSCRIIQLAIKQVAPNGTVLINKSKMYNPGVPITKEATEAHGYTDTDVKECPSLKSEIKKLKPIFENSIIIGYNILVFDIPVLLYEFDRCGVELDLSKCVFIDVMKLETQLSPRTLGAVYERYTGNKLEGAHEALADVDATAEVLLHQLEKIKKNKLDMKELMEKAGVPKDAADFFGKLKRDSEGYLIYNFGNKCRNKRVVDEPEYTNWVLSQGFPSQVKKLIREEQQKATKKQFTHDPVKKQDFYSKTNLSGPVKNDSDELPF